MALRNVPTSLGGLPVQIDYTARDYEAIRQELLSLASSLTPEWTDREPGDIGVTILEAVAYVGDILSYQLDRVQNEGYLASAQTRESVINILRLINYELAPASPATVSMVIQTDRAVTLPANFKVKTSSTGGFVSLEYELFEQVVLPQAGFYCVTDDVSLTNNIFSTNAVTEDDLIFVAGTQNVEALGTSDGTTDQVYQLSGFPVCLSGNGYSDISVTVGGTTYAARTSFVGEANDSKVFVYRFDEAQNMFILFGDGVNGKIPPTNDPLIATYRTDGGSQGNRAGVGSIIEHDPIVGVVQVYNVRQPSGGSDPETVLQAKQRGPRALRTLDRCVTLEDYESMAMLTPGGSIRAARAVVGDSPIDVHLYVAAEGVNPIPSGRWYPAIQGGSGDIGAVGRWINQKKPAPTRLFVFAPTVVRPYLEADVYVHSNLLRQTVSFEVDFALQVLFNDITDQFGEGIPLSAVTQTIENTQGVDYVDIKSFHRTPVARSLVGNEEAVELATFSVSDPTEKMRTQKYTVEWLSSTTFILRGDTFGVVKESSGTDLIYNANGSTQEVIFYNSSADQDISSQDTHFSLSITPGATSPTQGDVWEFSVDNYLGNIQTASYEIVVAEVSNQNTLPTNVANLSFFGGI